MSICQKVTKALYWHNVLMHPLYYVHCKEMFSVIIERVCIGCRARAWWCGCCSWLHLSWHRSLVSFYLQNVCSRAADDPSVSQSVFTITEKGPTRAPTRAFSWLKVPTKTLVDPTVSRHEIYETFLVLLVSLIGKLFNLFKYLHEIRPPTQLS